MSNRKYINTRFLKKCCSFFLTLPQAYLQPCAAGAENTLSVWKRGAGELRQETFPAEGKRGCKAPLQISALRSCGACWTEVLFQPRKMTGILCANWVQMWGWVLHITRILSCLHGRFRLRTISDFQIALCCFFSCRRGGKRGRIPLAPWLVEGDPVWEKKVFACFAVS